MLLSTVLIVMGHMYIFMKCYSSFLPTFIGLSFYYWFVGVFYICAFIKYDMNISSQSGFQFSSAQLLSYVWLCDPMDCSWFHSLWEPSSYFTDRSCSPRREKGNKLSRVSFNEGTNSMHGVHAYDLIISQRLHLHIPSHS